MQSYNPYLPLWEYIPDGEPHVFGDRVYLYGSHDRFGGNKYCMNDYVCWSANVHDLKEWRYEGIIYRSSQDPRMPDGNRQIWAPDVARGKDGRYYLYYCPDGDGEAIGVAVCNEPAGQYQFYGIVQDKKGQWIGKREGDIWQFDPGIFIDEDGKIYLYSGNGPKTEKDIGKTPKNSCVMELSDDMLTVIEEPRILLPILGKAKDTGFEGHEFFEASSVRKINGKYYLIYSSVRSRELCYAISEKPDREYRYAGVLSDNSGVIEEQDKNRIQIMWGNNHGSIEQINGKWYIFYHRPTNKTQFSRQACVEELVMLPDGRFQQAEMTSQGFNGAPLEKGTYPASIACILHGKSEPEISRPDSNTQPYVTQDAPDKNPDEIQDENAAPKQYITCIEDGGCAGYKYFQFDDLKKITITTRGCAKGEICVRIQENDKEIGRILVTPSEDWEKDQTDIKEWRGIGTLMLEYHGRGMLDMLEISLE